MRNPSYFFEASPEHALIDPDNLRILADHVKCAAFELPFSGTEQFGRHDLQQVLSILAEQGFVHRTSVERTEGAGLQSFDPDAGESDAVWTWTSESYPANAVSLRSVSADNFVVVDTTENARVIGETDFTSGPATLHPHAIYMVEGVLYQVESLDFDGRKAYVRQVDCDYYTDAITYTRVGILDTFAPTETAMPLDKASDPRAHGEVHVVSRVVGFKKIKFHTNENVGSGELDLPEQQMHTTAYWLTIPADLLALLPYAAEDRRDGVFGLAFAIKQIAQLLLMCDRRDIGTSVDAGEQSDPAALRGSTVPIAAGVSPRLFIYDNYPGGIGFSEPLYRMHHELLEGTHQLIAGCGCESGCPGCVGPAGGTGPLGKTSALRILELLLGKAALARSPADSEVQAF